MAQAEYKFSQALLQIGDTPKTEVDLAVFSEGGQQPPGEYRVDVFLNEKRVDTRVLTFTQQKDEQGKERLIPCLSTADLQAFDVNMAAFPALQAQGECVDFLHIIPYSTAEFVFSQQQLKLTLPQAALKNQARGYVSPERWDNGIPALLSNYSFSGAQSRQRGGGQQESSHFLSLRNGVNLGAWRLRNYSIWSRDDQGNNHWQAVNTYLQRDIVRLNSQLTLGDTNTPSEIFDSLSFRGAQLASVEAMYPDSLQGYAPVVRGIARSNAQVTTRQNGQIIDQRYVPPGEFEITDLYGVSGSGDLNVTIAESDGTQQQLIVPFASLPVLQREGRLSHSLTAGQYRPTESDGERSDFLQATLIYGLPWGVTVYGGTQLANRYQALAAGLGKNMGNAGAISLDVTQSWNRQRVDNLPEQDNQGQMWRLRYGKSFDTTGTRLTLAGYRYATEGFSTLQRALSRTGGSNSDGSLGDFSSASAQTRSRKEVSMQQGLGRMAGSLTLSLIEEDFWDNTGKRQSISLGYNGSLKGVSYGINYTQNKNHTGSTTSNTDRVIALNVSVPLNFWSQPAWASYAINHSNSGQTTQTVGLSGTALEGNTLNWGLTQGYTNQGQGENGNLSLAYRGSKALVSTSFSHDTHQQRLSYGLQGGILLHANGVTLSQPLNDTVVLVKAPGAAGVSILNNIGVKTDGRGYATVPYATPYRENQIALDPTTLPDDVELALTSKTVIPTQGAVVVADYQTKVGSRLMMTLLRSDGKPVPFGAQAALQGVAEVNSNIVGDGGQVYLTGMPEQGTLQVQWGAQPDQQCTASYRLPAPTAEPGIPMINGQCL
ncbi:fimbrial assembly protein [Chania multitudinisentens RB-25]|uniref:Fimbrial assembly protein n=1 Tax=Chania multitudinisentens RB-25 TaxID=1441930 RepID=W0LCA9_9GAMM|nr:fimbrial assembly protein [Chania multitudinisentens RB-25]